jgi:hypothetical protein
VDFRYIVRKKGERSNEMFIGFADDTLCPLQMFAKAMVKNADD